MNVVLFSPSFASYFFVNLRLELCMLLENEHIFEPETNNDTVSSSHPLSYEKVTSCLSTLSLFIQHVY